jgi:hypothetical protein
MFSPGLAEANSFNNGRNMGIDVMGIFQRFDGERWVTVDCDDGCYPVLEEDDPHIYSDGHRGLLRFWLGWGDGGQSTQVNDASHHQQAF